MRESDVPAKFRATCACLTFYSSSSTSTVVHLLRYSCRLLAFRAQTLQSRALWTLLRLPSPWTKLTPDPWPRLSCLEYYTTFPPSSPSTTSTAPAAPTGASEPFPLRSYPQHAFLTDNFLLKVSLALSRCARDVKLSCSPIFHSKKLCPSQTFTSPRFITWIHQIVRFQAVSSLGSHPTSHISLPHATLQP